MNDLLKIQIRNIVTGLCYELVGFQSRSDGVVVCIGLKSISGNGYSFSKSINDIDWNDFQVVKTP